MNNSMGIILRELDGRFRFESNINEGEDYPVRLFQVWDGSKPEHEVLYIINSEELKSNPYLWNYNFIIGYNLEKENLKISTSKWISIQEVENLPRIINELQRIFQKFHEWTGRVDKLLYNATTIDTILNDLEDTYSLMSILVSKNLKFLSVSKKYPDYNSWLGDKNYMSLDMLNELLADEEFRNAQKHNETFIYETDIDKDMIKHSYCYNIKRDNEYVARLLVHCKSYVKCFGISYITAYLGKKIAEVISNYDFGEAPIYTNHAFKEMIGDMLKGIHINSMKIKECLKELKWEQGHWYQIYIFDFLQKEVPNASHIYYRTQLEEFFGNCYVIEENNKFNCLINLTLSPIDKKNNRHTLSVFLRDNLCKVGISNEFNDLALLSEYYKEADIALFIGTNYNSTAWCYHYSELIMPYLKHQMTRGINTEHLIHPAIKILEEYDHRENTQLVKTVETFIKNKYNITHTADELYIHRTSLMVRLNRIKQLTGVTFESYEEIQYLMLSFMLR